MAIKVGDIFKLRTGREVTVIKYENCDKITITDCYGNLKITTANGLRTGYVKIGDSTIEYFKNNFLAKNYLPLTLKCGVVVDLVEYINKSKIIIGDNEGNTKTVSASAIIENSISWKCFGYKTQNILSIEEVFESCKWGKYKILRFNKTNTSVDVQWVNSGNIQTDCDIYLTKAGLLTDSKAIADSYWNYLGVDPKKYYVYEVTMNGEILYIGKGIRRRYLHPTSGGSSCVELNRLYFQGVKVTVSILEQGLEKNEAFDLEKYYIKKFSPKYNLQHNN